MQRSAPLAPVRIWLSTPLRFHPPSEIPMSTPAPTFTGLENVAGHLRRSFDKIALVIVERVVNRNDNTKVAAIDLSPEALRAFLPLRGPEATSALPDSANEPPMGPDEQREAMLAWLRQTFAANMEGKPSVKFKVGLWTPKREVLVGSARVTVSGLPSVPAPQPAARVFVLDMPGAEPLVTADLDLVEAHGQFLAMRDRALTQLHRTTLATLEVVVGASEAMAGSDELTAKVNAVCGLPPDYDWLAPRRSNVIPFQGPPKS